MLGSAGEIIKSFNIVVEICLVFWIFVLSFLYIFFFSFDGRDFINYNSECVKKSVKYPCITRAVLKAMPPMIFVHTEALKDNKD